MCDHWCWAPAEDKGEEWSKLGRAWRAVDFGSECSSGLSSDMSMGLEPSQLLRWLFLHMSGPGRGVWSQGGAHRRQKGGCRTVTPAQIKHVKSLDFLPLSAARGQGSPSASSFLSGKVSGLQGDWQEVMSTARRSCRRLGGDPCLITSAEIWHVTQHSLRQKEHFVLTLCTSLPASCPLIPPRRDFPLPPQLPVPWSPQRAVQGNNLLPSTSHSFGLFLRPSDCIAKIKTTGGSGTSCFPQREHSSACQPCCRTPGALSLQVMPICFLWDDCDYPFFE